MHRSAGQTGRRASAPISSGKTRNVRFDLPGYGAYDRTPIQILGLWRSRDPDRAGGASNRVEAMRQRRRRAIIWLTAAGMLLSGSHRLSAAQERPAPAASAEDATALAQVIDAAAAGRPAGELSLAWLGQHYIRSQGDSVYIPFTLTLDRKQLASSAVTVFIRAINRTPPPAGAPKYAWETAQSVDVPADGRFARAIALTPGTYDVFVAVKERGTAGAKAGVVKRELTVPSFANGELATSSIILARSLEQMAVPLAPDKQQDNPYVFGPLKVTPFLDDAFPKTGDLQVLFWIYGASQTAGKPDVQVDFSFHHVLPDGEKKYFNRTNPQELSTRTLPAEFNLALHQLLSSLSVPLASFPPGNYLLEIKVTDKPSGKSLTNSVNFAVSAS
jgi:hypothetical protein